MGFDKSNFLAQYGTAKHIDQALLNSGREHLVHDNPALNSGHISTMLANSRTEPNIIAALAKRSDILTKDHIDKMVNSKEPRVIESIASHGKLEDHHVEKLMKDGLGTRASLAINPHLHKHHIDTLSNDKDDWVKMAVTANPSATREQKEHAASGLTDPRKIGTVNARRELGWFK